MMHDLGAPDRLAGGRIDRARLEGLFPKVGGLGLGASRCGGADERKKRKDADFLHGAASLGSWDPQDTPKRCL